VRALAGVAPARPIANAFAKRLLTYIAIFMSLEGAEPFSLATRFPCTSCHSGASGAVNPDTIDDATLKQTAKAYVKVRQIVQTAEQDLNKTTDNAQQQEIAKLAGSRKMAAVKAEGLQPQQYNQVIQLARVDKAFEQKFLSYVNEVKNSPSWAQ
jgi:ribosome-binding protein aMBF1 (putative translation factor)